jgi:hypothetical protein
MNEWTCPACGTKRLGAFRFCRTCRLDFDALAALAEPVEAPAPPLTPATSGAAWRIATGTDRPVPPPGSAIARHPVYRLPDGW